MLIRTEADPKYNLFKFENKESLTYRKVVFDQFKNLAKEKGSQSSSVLNMPRP